MSKKIFLLITGLDHGGAENQLFSTAITLKKRGWDVYAISMRTPVAFVTELNGEGIPVFSLNMRRKWPDPVALFRFTALVRRFRPDVVHSHMVHANIFARFTRMMCRIPVLVCTAHSIYEGRKWREYAYRYTDRFCDLTTNVCLEGVDRAISKRTVPREKIRYIPNGVDTNRFSPSHDLRQKMRLELGLGKKYTFLAVGRFETPKDYPNMLKAFARVCKDEKDVVLLIVGDGALRSEMEFLARILKVESNVLFLGIRKDVPALMNAADSFVMSSAWEGMPMVLLEAAAMGLPIVATAVGGVGDVVLDGENGILVTPGDDKQLSEAMTELKRKSEQELLKMRSAAIEHIKDNYTIEKIVAHWERLYESILACKAVKS